MCFSRCWNACWATYAILAFVFFHTSPDVGFSSPINNFIAVDLPAPFGPTTETRDDVEHDNEISVTDIDKLFKWIS